MNLTQIEQGLRGVAARRINLGQSTVSSLARRTGYAQSTISNWLRGKRSASIASLDTLLAALSVDLEIMPAKRTPQPRRHTP